MPTGDRNDPWATHNFIIEIDGVTKAGFSECSGLTNETDAIEYRNGNQITHVTKIPGLTKYGNITLKRGFTTDKKLWEWRKKVVDGKTERATGTITLLDEARQPAMRWNFREAWPRKLDGPAFNAKTNDVAIETLEIVVEQLQVE
jgi:phage tail-like protein